MLASKTPLLATLLYIANLPLSLSLSLSLPSSLPSPSPSSAETCSSPTSYWKIDNFILKVYDWDKGGSTGTFGFRSYYSATNKTVECVVRDVNLATLSGDGSSGGGGALSWTKCNGNSGGTEFRFDLDGVSLTVRESWVCEGVPGKLFSATATGRMMLHGCLENDTAKGVESDCNLMELEMAGDVTSSVLI